jgi:hypothetical protein
MSDALTQLRAAVAPKGGMQRIPFPTESYEHASKPLSAKRLLNCFVEQAPADAHSTSVLRTTPALVYRETLGSGPFEAFSTQLIGGYYAVSGTQAFRNAEGVTTMIGDVGTPTDPQLPAGNAMATIACSPFAVVICVPPNLFTARHDEATLTQIDTSGFPGGGCNSIAFLDGYFVGTQHGRGNTFFLSGLQDPLSWDALDFANVEGMTNILLRAINQRGELWLLGYAGAEIWYDAGAADFPLRRQSGGTLPYGFVIKSVAQIDGSVWWVSRDGNVYRSVGYQAQRVSTHAVEGFIELSNPDYAIGMAYLQEGHAHYCFTLPDINRTLCYDIATKQWHDRSSDDGSSPWRALVAGRIGEAAYCGDASGRMYTLDPSGTTDDGNPIVQQVTFPPIYAGTRRAFCARLEVEMQVGSSPLAPSSVVLDWSDDGGITWTGGPRTLVCGPGLRQRVVATRLGSFRQRVFRLTTLGRASIYDVSADITPGDS